MKNIVAICAVVMGSVLVAPAMAGGGRGELSIPGVLTASGGTTSTVKNSTIAVTNNKSGSVTVGGGSISAKVVSVDMPSIANVNTVNVTGSTVESSTILVDGNKSDNVNAYGGGANVNSVNIN